jgi:hypothetical protein
MGSLVHGIQALVILALSAGAFGVEVWALVSAAKAPPAAYTLAGRLPKGAWVGITAAAAAVGLAALPTPFFSIPFGGLLSIAALVAALVFLVSVRPKTRGFKRPPSTGPRTSGGW